VVSSIDLAAAEISLSSLIGRERMLSKALLQVDDRYDYILIDTPPSLGLLTVNALTAADGVIVPVQCEYLSLRGLAQLEAEGRIFTKNWTLYDGFHVVFWPKKMTPFELQEILLQAHRRFYRGRRILTVNPKAPMYRKHQVEGYLISRAWEHVRENREFLRELKELSESQAPPLSVTTGFMKSGLETVTR
jgi:cellulose biosynthesis protein BcsQ